MTIFYNANKLIKQYEYQERKELVNMDIILKSILRRQMPFLIGIPEYNKYYAT
ncbi:MAG: hypothetical protein ACJ72V_19815 [Nitrososphaeraceae archaeon]